MYEMMLLNNTAAGNDVNAAVDDVCVQAIERLIRLLLAPGSACACVLCCDSIQVANCLLTNEMGLAPVSNRVVTESEVRLVPVAMQHVRYMVSTSLSSQLHVMCNRE